jgi:hypothetical protein
MDTSKPVGDACREDGTLKDASEMEWPESPTQLAYNQALIEDQFHEDVTATGSELEWPASTGSEADEAPKVKVR